MRSGFGPQVQAGARAGWPPALYRRSSGRFEPYRRRGAVGIGSSEVERHPYIRVGLDGRWHGERTVRAHDATLQLVVVIVVVQTDRPGQAGTRDVAVLIVGGRTAKPDGLTRPVTPVGPRKGNCRSWHRVVRNPQDRFGAVYPLTIAADFDAVAIVVVRVRNVVDCQARLGRTWKL